MSRKQQKPKNRNKAYKPKKDQLTKDQIKQLIRKGKGTDRALRAHLEKFSQLKPYDLEMSWDLLDVERTLDMYCYFNGLDPDGTDPLPLQTLQSVYKGDLIIGIRRNIIPAAQEFKIRIFNTRVRLKDDHSVVLDAPDYVRDFTGDPIDYNIFMQGEVKGKHYFKRDGEFKVVWQGLTKEWGLFIDPLFDDEYEVCHAQATLSCTTPFNTWNDEKQFQQIKLMSQARKFV